MSRFDRLQDRIETAAIKFWENDDSDLTFSFKRLHSRKRRFFINVGNKNVAPGLFVKFGYTDADEVAEMINALALSSKIRIKNIASL